MAKPVSREGYYRYEFSNGEYIEATDDHPFWDPVTKQWKSFNPPETLQTYLQIDAVYMLAIGDHFLHESGAILTLTNATYIKEDVIVYAFLLDEMHTYFANGILTHNGHGDPPTHVYVYYYRKWWLRRSWCWI